MNKTKQEIVEDIEQSMQKKFIDEIKEVESKHGYRLIAQMAYTDGAIFARLGLQKLVKETTEIDVSKLTAQE